MKQTTLLTAALVGLTSVAHAQWASQPVGFSGTAAAVYIDAVDNSVAWATAAELVAMNANQQFARTMNGGTTWTVDTVTGLGPNDQVTSIFGLNATTAWVTVLRDAAPGQILKTTDGGATWTVQTTPTQFAGARSWPNYVHFFNATEGVAIGDPDTSLAGFEIYTTANGGTTWTRVAGVPASTMGEVGLVTPPAAAGNSLWFGSNEGRVFYSTDKGATWAVSNTGIGEINSIAFRDATNGLALSLDENSTSHLLARTTNGGQTWNPVTYTGPLHGVGIDNVPGTGQYVSVGANIGNGDTGSSYSRDNGQTWVALENTVDHYVLDFASPTAAWSSRISSGTGAGQGVNKLTSTVLGNRAVAASQLGLNVYPNPSTDGRFTVAAQQARGAVAWRVFDALGRQVVANQPGATPAGSLTVDLSREKAGLYTLELRTDAGVAQQKLVVR